MPFEPQRIDARKIVVGPKKQTTYGQPLLAASFTHLLRFDGGANFAQLAKGFRTDGDRSGKSHPWVTERQEVQRDSALSLEVAVTDFLAGWLMAWVFQKQTISGAGPYTHTFTFENATRQAAVTSLYLVDTADIKYKLIDLAIAEIEISGGPNGEITARASLIGSGKHTDGADATVDAVALPTNIYLLSSDVDVLLGAVGAAASIKERVRSWTVRFNQNLVMHRGSGGGFFASMTKIGPQRATVSLQVDAKETDDIRTLFLNDTLRELQINCNSGAAAQMNCLFKGIYLSAAPLGADGAYQVWNLEADEQSVIKNGANEVAQVTVINSQSTSYLTAG